MAENYSGRNSFWIMAIALIVCATLPACGRNETPATGQVVGSSAPAKNSAVAGMKKMPQSYWRSRLSPQAYHVTREKGTEAPFVNEYWRHRETGDYVCSNCYTTLFASSSKFDTECGWPAFSEPVNKRVVETEVDSSHNMVRTEVTCANCGAHLGHVFKDGPGPAGDRFCINSVSLKFRKASDKAGSVR